MSPKTVSTRCIYLFNLIQIAIPDEDYLNVDFEDEEAFKKMQAKLNERNKKIEEEERKKEQEEFEKQQNI